MKPLIKENLIEPDWLNPAKKGNELAQAVIAAAREVYRHLGPGFAREIYEEALCAELNEAHLPFERRREVGVLYKNWPIGRHRLPLLVAETLIVEVMDTEELTSVHRAQMVAWLKATSLHLGLLIAFNAPLWKNCVQRVSYRNNQAQGWSYARNGVQ